MRIARLGALFLLLAPAAMSSRAQTTVQLFDPGNSSASFLVHFRFLPQAGGQFSRVSGELQPEAGQQRVLVSVDGRSLVFHGPNWMNRVTRSDDFLAVDHYPEISFRSESFAPDLLRTGGELRGELALRGQRRTVAFRLLPSACPQPGRDCDIQVQGSVSRREFGMTSYRFSVRDNVDFDFRVRLMAKAKP
jgi:polyisoprenoid-binding protein YceI